MASPIYTDNSYDALVMGIMNTIFGYGGEMGDYATNQVQGITNSKESIEGLKLYKELYEFCPPDWSKTFFQEANQAFTQGLVADEHEFLCLLPGARQRGHQQVRQGDGLLCHAGRPDRQTFCGAWRTRAFNRQLLQETRPMLTSSWNGSFARTSRRSGAELGGYTCDAKILESKEFREATPYNEAFYQSMQIVKDFWTIPEYAEMLIGGAKALASVTSSPTKVDRPKMYRMR